VNDYCLIDCDFHDQLELLAISQQICQITYCDAAKGIVEVRSQIVDVYAANKADFLQLKDGTEIRLDRLLSVNGTPICFVQE
jgi:Rho-binding antiterminator